MKFQEKDINLNRHKAIQNQDPSTQPTFTLTNFRHSLDSSRPTHSGKPLLLVQGYLFQPNLLLLTGGIPHRICVSS